MTEFIEIASPFRGGFLCRSQPLMYFKNKKEEQFDLR
nr:MAG TPA: hypothetical protein [Caudoviricetes sp.]